MANAPVEARIAFPGLSSSVKAVVYLLEEACSADAMRRLASGARHEVTFAWPLGNALPGAVRPRAIRYGVRWFSQGGETQLCSTGALAATACISAREGDGAPVELESPRVALAGRREGPKRVAVRLPRASDVAPYGPAPVLREALRLQVPICGAVASRERQMALLHLPSAQAVASLRPDWDALKEIQSDELGAVIVAAEGAGRFDVVYRYFTPWHGKNESAVAGSALALLGPYWRRHAGEDSFRCHQRSALGASFAVQVAPQGVWIGADVALPEGASPSDAALV